MIVIEANEIPPEIFEWFSSITSGIISKTIKKDFLSSTLIDDVSEAELYPSQAWASVSTGYKADKHEIRWYNDATERSPFYWRHLASMGKKVCIMNVLHTGSISEEEKNNYDFLFPDFFSIKPKTNLKKYIPFQKFNNDITLASGRKTSKKQILFKALRSFFANPFPNHWGISIRDSFLWIKLIKGISTFTRRYSRDISWRYNDGFGKDQVINIRCLTR